MKRRTFISMMSVMAAAGVLTLSGCSNSSTSTAASAGASSAAGSAADQLAAIQASGKLIVALEGAWQPWSYHDESDTLVGYDVEVSRAGENEHHKIEGVFKAFSRALRMAIARNGFKFELPSSKGVL